MVAKLDSFDLIFKMKIKDDVFEWIDKTVSPRTYKVKDVRDNDKSDWIIKFVVLRNNSKKIFKKGDLPKSVFTNNRLQLNDRE